MFSFRMRLRPLPRFAALTKPYWSSDEKWIARGLLALLVGLLPGNTAFVPDNDSMPACSMS